MVVEGRGPGARGAARRPPPERDQAPERARGAPARQASEDELGELFGARRPASSDRWARASRWSPTRPCAALRGLVAGANEPDLHLRGVEPGRDFEPTWADVRTRRGRRHAARTAATIRIEPAIEVGNIFKLGTRYSEPLGATYLDEEGSEQLDLDGLLRHRPGAHRGRRHRAVRRRAGHLLAARDRPVRRRAGDARQGGRGGPRRCPSGSTRSCARPGLDVLYDDRDGERGGEVRRRRAARLPAAADGGQARAWSTARWRCRSGAGRRSAPCRWRAPRRRRRSCGAGSPDPPAAARARPLRRRRRRRRCASSRSTRGRCPTRSASSAWRCCRCSCVLALASGDGRDATATILFAVIAWSDYLDGMAARITGQYSRLGALLDPLVDRLLVVSGRGRVLALRAAAALGAGRAGRPGAVDARADPGRAAQGDRPQDQHARPLGGVADDVRARRSRSSG